MSQRLLDVITQEQAGLKARLDNIQQEIIRRLDSLSQHVTATSKILASLNPENVLKRGYAIVTNQKSRNDDFDVGSVVKITTFKQQLTAEIKNVEKRTSI